MSKKDIKLIVDGKRTDGRTAEQLRAIEMKVDVISRANGSALVKFGNTHAIASVYGPRELFPRFLQEQETGILRCRYAMAPFSVDDRKAPGTDRRGTEISKVMRLAFEPALFLSDFPKVTVDAFAEILQADGSTRCTAINTLSLALADAGISMRDLVTAVSVGKIEDTLVVDLNGVEDNNSDSDMAVAMMPSKKKITLLQMDGRITKEDIMSLLEMAVKNCEYIYELQKSALREKYKKVD